MESSLSSLDSTIRVYDLDIYMGFLFLENIVCYVLYESHNIYLCIYSVTHIHLDPFINPLLVSGFFLTF